MQQKLRAIVIYLVAFFLLVPVEASALDAGLMMGSEVRHVNHSTGLEAAIYWGLLALVCTLAVICSLWLAKRAVRIGIAVRVSLAFIGLVALSFHSYGLHYFTTTELQPDHIKGSLIMGIGVIVFILGMILAVFPNPSNSPIRKPNIQGRFAKSSG